MNFIKKVFENKIDEEVHLQFQKFSKGEFRNRAMIRVKCSGGKCTIYTSAEFANEFVKMAAEKLGERKTQVTGAVVSTSDLAGQLDFRDKKQFQGVKRYLIDNEMSGNEILELLEKFPRTFFALTFNVGDEKLKIKPKAPKSGKPGKENKDPKINFCKFVTTDEAIKNSFVFEDANFKEAIVNHTFFIDEIVIPDELKDEKDLAKVREMAKRKGKIVREANIDGNVVKEEKEFVA